MGRMMALLRLESRPVELIHRWVLSALLALLALPGLGFAQDPLTSLKELTIAVWPEYDQPSVLVIYEGTLQPDIQLPRPLQVTIPEGSIVNAVAYRDHTGNLLSLPWESEARDNQQVISFELGQPGFVVEYYADIIAPPPDRGFSLNLDIPYAVDEARLLLRQPARATDFEATPELPAAAPDELGNPQYAKDLGALAAGEAIDLSVSYTKTDEEPSLSSVLLPGTPGPSPSPDGEETPVWLFVVGGLVAGAAIAGGIFGAMTWYRRRQSASRRTRQGRRRQERRGGRQASKNGTTDEFCPQCGRKYAAGDQFCRSCGTPRR